MNDKAFQEFIVTHLTELSSEVKELRQSQTKISGEIEELRQSQTEISGEIEKLAQSQARMESELTDKVRALFDAREVQNDVNGRIISALSRIENKLDNQSWELKLTRAK